MIYFDKVSKIYSPTSTALDDVSFAIEPGEFVSIVGQTLAGKTSWMKLRCAEEKPTSGKGFFESVYINTVLKKD